MKAVLKAALIIFLICFILPGCSKESPSTLPTGAYTMRSDSELPGPALYLQDGGKFSFTYSLFSSYIPMGTYEVKNGNLILNTEKEHYTFDIKDGKLIFNASASTPVPFGEVKDGAVFVLQK